VKQLKHGLQAVKQKANNGSKSKTIPWKTVCTWLTSTQALLTQWEAEYKIIYVFITNKTITNIPEPQFVAWPSNLTVVHKPCLLDYYGPTVYQFASLSPDDN
jgi:hypothetical protein